MPGNEKGSFWTTTSGLTTGIAGTLTGVLGIVAVANQAGWIGGDDGGDQQASTATSESAAGTTSTTEGGGSTTTDDDASTTDDRATTTRDRATRSATTETPIFSVSPSALRFTALGARTAMAEVRNTGDVDLDVQNVTVEGPDDGRFSVDATPCTSAAVEPDRSCEVEVTFNPAQGGGAAEATMVIDVADADSREVPLAGESLL